MPRGQPDYGMYAVKEVSASISDMGEVAARLGSILIYDKRGDVVDFDNFEEPLIGWEVSFHVAEGSAYLDSTSVLSGSQALRLISANGVDADQFINSYLAILASKRLGFEISFSDLDDNTYLYLQCAFDDGTNLHLAQLRVDALAEKLYVWNDTPAWEEVGDTGMLRLFPFSFYTVKLVMDFATDKYVRLLFAQQEIDISTIKFPSTGVGVGASIRRYIACYNKVATGGEVWVDNFIFTQAEP